MHIHTGKMKWIQITLKKNKSFEDFNDAMLPSPLHLVTFRIGAARIYTSSDFCEIQP
jgi:hypothetical protein